jgi:sensor histidine kinase regulating citrate/malate metabolism
MNILVERRIATYQNDLAVRHCEEVENIYKQMRGWRHDYHNHIQAMKAYIAGNQIDILDDYLSMLNRDLTSVDTVIKTGNVMVDAILNSKTTIAKSRNISVNAKAVVPKNLSVQDVDLCVILGNLLDNAIESCEKIINEHERFIRIYIGIHKELLYISVTNSAGGELKKTGRNYLSTKASASHGFGLVRIDKIIEKYNGFIDRQNEEGVFATEAMLPL